VEPLRADGRSPHQPRPVRIEVGVLLHPEGSALIEMGRTRVLCTVTVEERIPPFLRGAGRGWVTAEYGMLPRSTRERIPRDPGRERGRMLEIQRLIGRSLRAVTDLTALGQRTFVVDCDVLQADGGTRTASITGAYVALYHACWNLLRQGLLERMPLRCAVAGISAGVVDGIPMVDLDYEEDVRAQVDLNLALTEHGDLVEVQGTGEAGPFSRQTLLDLLDLAWQGVQPLFSAQRSALAGLALP